MLYNKRIVIKVNKLSDENDECKKMEKEVAEFQFVKRYVHHDRYDQQNEELAFDNLFYNRGDEKKPSQIVIFLLKHGVSKEELLESSKEMYKSKSNLEYQGEHQRGYINKLLREKYPKLVEEFEKKCNKKASDVKSTDTIEGYWEFFKELEEKEKKQ